VARRGGAPLVSVAGGAPGRDPLFLQAVLLEGVPLLHREGLQALLAAGHQARARPRHSRL